MYGFLTYVAVGLLLLAPGALLGPVGGLLGLVAAILIFSAYHIHLDDKRRQERKAWKQQ